MREEMIMSMTFRMNFLACWRIYRRSGGSSGFSGEIMSCLMDFRVGG